MTHTCTKVTVRQRAIRNNRISLYLDYYPAVRNPETMQMSRREYLGIYIYAHPKNEMEREFNNDMLNKAEAIRCIRVQSLINGDDHLPASIQTIYLHPHNTSDRQHIGTHYYFTTQINL